MKQNFIIACLFFVNFFGCAQDKINITDYQSDIEYLKNTLPKKHPNLYFHQRKEVFNDNLDRISSEANLSSNSKLTIQMQLREAIAGLGDPHTNFGFYDAIDAMGYFPLEIYWFNDGIWIMGADAKYKNTLGKKLVAINDIPIEIVLEKVSKVVPKNEPYFAKKRMHYFLMSNGIMNAYKLNEGNSALFTFRGLSGKNEVIEVKANNNEYLVDQFESLKNLPEFWQRPQSDEVPLFQSKYIDQDSILVIQYNRCWGRELEEKFGDKTEAEKLPYFKDFVENIFQTLEEKPINKVLFDMRFNGGGSSPQGTWLVEQLSQFKEVNQRGDLFVATSEHTFSSAVINTMNFRQMTEAIIIGTPSGGTPNHYGEVRTLTLPKTGLEIYHSTNYFKYTEKKEAAVYPDITIDTKYSDISNGIDPVYEFVKNYKH